MPSIRLSSSERAMFQVGIEITKEPVTITPTVISSDDFGMEAKGMLAKFLYHITKSSFVKHLPR